MSVGGKRGTIALYVAIAAAFVYPAYASGAPKVPYPAFIQADALPDAFLAGLPGVRAKQFGSAARSISMSSRLLLPANWDFSTGATPDKSVEIFVLAGEIEVQGFTLRAGGYAYLPGGSMGSGMRTRSGAQILYFLNDVDDRAAIRVPLISGIDSAQWKPISDDPADFGLSVMVLRSDPGSGAKTWLLKIDPVAEQSWQSFSADVEGYLVTGKYRHSECVAGKVVSADYSSGGYFLRPAGAINAGPKARSLETSIWYLRALNHGEQKTESECVP